MSDFVPKDCYIWFGENCVADGGDIIPHKTMDVTQINLAVDLRGELIGKVFELTLQDNNDPGRTFVSTTEIDKPAGNYVGYISFMFESMHVQDADSYNIKLCVSDDTNLTFGMIADWQPTINTSTKTQKVAGPRVKMFGVTSGLYAC